MDGLMRCLMFALAAAAAPTTIEVVDVSALRNTSASEAALAATRLSASFAATGFALVRGHGVQTETLETLREAARGFFADDGKFAFDKGKGYGHGGYVRHQEAGAQLLGDFSRPHDLVESLTIGGLANEAGTESIRISNSSCAEPPATTRREPRGSVWAPLRELWRRGRFAWMRLVRPGRVHESTVTWGAFQPADETPPTLRAPATAFAKEASALGNIVAEALQLALGVRADELDAVTSRRTAGVRLAHYAAQPSDALPGQMRYGAHVDSGTITVLSLDPSNPHGLQVDVNQQGGGASATDEADRVWVDVPFVNDTLVLNVGALLSRWTGGRWKAAVHRVLNGDASRDRTSVVTSALGAKPNGPPFAGFAECMRGATEQAAAVRAADFLSVRVALHRPEYAKEQGLETSEQLTEESRRIVALHK